MARKKTESKHIDPSTLEKGSKEFASKLGQAFTTIITNNYGHARAPKAIMTPFNVKPLDALLGGGIVSSAPVMLSSTPETGKSTCCFQLAKQFQEIYENSVCVYLDIEGSGNVAESTDFQTSRMESFGLDPERFKYEPIVLNVLEVFDTIDQLVGIKRQFEEKLQQEFYVLVIWDSIAATASSKVGDASDPDRVIGVKARQLTFALEKYASLLAFNRITFLTVDQVRANIKIGGIYEAKESSVGTFKDFKAASSIAALNHRITQWLFLSKGKNISPMDGYTGVDGWFINIMTEKNKFAPSKHAVSVVFDKSTGINKFWSEYHFLSEQTPTELKIYKNKTFPYKMSIMKSGAWVQLKVRDPETGKVDYNSDKFYKKDAKHKYETDVDFKKWFDYAVDIAIHTRIKEGMFKINIDQIVDDISVEVSQEEIIVDGVLNDEQPQNLINHEEIQESDIILNEMDTSDQINNEQIQESDMSSNVIASEDTTIHEDGYQSVF